MNAYTSAALGSHNALQRTVNVPRRYKALFESKWYVAHFQFRTTLGHHEINCASGCVTNNVLNLVRVLIQIRFVRAPGCRRGTLRRLKVSQQTHTAYEVLKCDAL